MKWIWPWLLAVTQFAGCREQLCKALQAESPFDARVAVRSVMTSFVRDIALTESGDVVFAHHDGATASVQRFSDREGMATLVTFPHPNGPDDRLHVEGDGSWTYIAGGRLFHGDSGPAAGSARVHLPSETYPFITSLNGPEPRGLYLAYREGGGVIAREFTAAGVVRTWRWAGGGIYGMERSSWLAELLRDGRIAVVSLESYDEHPSRVMLHLLAADGSVEERVLRTGERARFGAITTNEQGQLGVVAVFDGNRIDGLVVDPKPDAPIGEWRRLSAPDTTASFPAIAATKTGFAVSWVSGMGSSSAILEARELSAAAIGPLITRVGPMSVRERPRVVTSVSRTGDDVTFVWENDGDLMARRFPSDFSGFTPYEEFRDLFCAAVRKRR